MVFLSQLKLLMWKDLLLQRHKMRWTITELMLPVVFAFILVLLRSQIRPKEQTKPTEFEVSSPHGGFNDHLTRPINLTELGFSPDTNLTRQVMENVLDDLYDDELTTGVFSLHGFDTERELVDYHENTSRECIYMAVVFKDLDRATILPTSLTYYLRPWSGGYARWNTHKTYAFFLHDEPRTLEFPDYTNRGVLTMQILVARSLMKQWSNNGSNNNNNNSSSSNNNSNNNKNNNNNNNSNNSNSSSSNNNTLRFDFKMQKMPYPPYVNDRTMARVFLNSLPLLLVLSVLVSVMHTVQRIVYEKEKKLKESMKLMGLIPAAYWTAWFLTCFAYMALAMAIYTMILTQSIAGSYPVLVNTDPSLFYAFLLCYAVAIITFCFMISATVQNAKVAVLVSGAVFIAFYGPNVFLSKNYQTLTYGQKMAASLLFNQAMAFGVIGIGLFEEKGQGVRWSNVHQTAYKDDNYTLLNSMLMLIVDTGLHLLVTWYLDNVWPGEFGMPKPANFCLEKSYWFGSSPENIYKTSRTNFHMNDRHFQREPPRLKAGIEICELTKVFSGDVAVNKLSLNIYEGQITVLLGHNGAGKTTTMSMLTGFVPPTSGTAFINDQNIRTDLQTIRRTLGLCPQHDHDILFGGLSVEKHLTFFAMLKGCTRLVAKAEMERMIAEVGLEEQRNKASRKLSGGEQRKLCVAIALIAGSKVIVLDEPTAGMDPSARREIWEVLQRHKAGRTMLLTTRFMDEADLLGDRIAIMAQGVVTCCGKSKFLKKLYGIGHHLVVVKGKTCLEAEVTKAITATIQSAILESEVNAELSYLLPGHQSHLYQRLFDWLDVLKDKLGIVYFGVSATTMEDIFLRQAESNKEEDWGKTPTHCQAASSETQTYSSSYYYSRSGVSFLNVDSGTSTFSARPPASGAQGLPTLSSPARPSTLIRRTYTKLSGWRLLRSRMTGLVIKKAIHSWRNRVTMAMQLLLPVAFTIMGLVADMDRPVLHRKAEPSLDFSLDPFGPTTVAYTNGSRPNVTSEQMAQLYGHQLWSDETMVKVDGQKRKMTSFFVNFARDKGTFAFTRRVIIGAEFDSSDTHTLRAVSWFNGQPYHAQPVALAYTLNALARKYVNSDVDMRSGVYPLPAEKWERVDKYLAFLRERLVVGVCVSIGMAFLTNSFIHFLVKERITGAKHLQVLSGASPLEFWCSNLLWDYVNYLLPCLVLLLVFSAIGHPVYVDEGRLGLVFLLLALHGLAVLPSVYLFHFLSEYPVLATGTGIVFSIFTGVIPATIVYFFRLKPQTQSTSISMNWGFLALFPNHCLAGGFMDMYLNHLNHYFCHLSRNYTAVCLIRKNLCCKNVGLGCEKGGLCLDFTDSYSSWSAPGVGRYLVFMALQSIVFFTATVLLDSGLPAKLTNKLCGSVATKSRAKVMSEDEDVAAERARVKAAAASKTSQGDALLLASLYKRYGSFVAVDRICVRVPEKGCFGLLGENGAGKTSTIKMLTGDEHITEGHAFVNGCDINENLRKMQGDMGYCPQVNPLVDQMTGRETLTLYGRLRGVSESHLETCVDDLINTLMLTPCADKQSGEYSGGNKRKLSTAIALIGDPPFILLDEPSTGMDPAAKRHLWKVLSAVRASGRTLVLTSTSMEECEALCTRIAIMVNGRFVCLGSSQHLKSKFGQGYTLQAKMDTAPDTGDPAPFHPFVSFIKQTFHSTRLFYISQGYVYLQVPSSHARMSQIFSAMEHAKKELRVHAYHVHRTTLKEVFLDFTRHQMPRNESSLSCEIFSCLGSVA